MRYTSVLDASEQSFQNLINDAEDFENDKIFASIRSRDYDESDINLINAEVRISIAKIDKEYISLENFLKSSISYMPPTTTNATTQLLSFVENWEVH